MQPKNVMVVCLQSKDWGVELAKQGQINKKRK
jgi:hypothetical protein